MDSRLNSAKSFQNECECFIKGHHEGPGYFYKASQKSYLLCAYEKYWLNHLKFLLVIGFFSFLIYDLHVDLFQVLTFLYFRSQNRNTPLTRCFSIFDYCYSTKEQARILSTNKIQFSLLSEQKTSTEIFFYHSLLLICATNLDNSSFDFQKNCSNTISRARYRDISYFCHFGRLVSTIYKDKQAVWRKLDGIQLACASMNSKFHFSSEQ